jgi:DNA polymerase III alpha subunit (gram-positive type)
MEIKDNFISVDVESTGPCPGIHSMINFGAVSVSEPTYQFSASLEELPGGAWSVGTRKFWNETEQNRATLAKFQAEASNITAVMWDFREWLSEFKRPILVSHPITFDFSFLNYYWWLVFDSDPPFGWGGCDIKTLGMAVLKTGFRESTKRTMKKKIAQTDWHHMKHTHDGLGDALEQAELFRTLMKLV